MGCITELLDDDISPDIKWQSTTLDSDQLEIRNSLITRRVREAEFGVKRTLNAMYKHGLPYPKPTIHEGAGGQAGQIIRKYFEDENMRAADVWSWLPLGWWRQARVKKILNDECDALEGLTIGLSQAMQGIMHRKSGVDRKKDKLVRFLNASRKEMVEIGHKTVQKITDDGKNRAGKANQIKKATNYIDKCKQRVANEQKLIQDCSVMLDEGDVPSVFNVVDSLGMEEFAAPKGKKRRSPDAPHLAIMIDKARAVLKGHIMKFIF